jgi:hypothetical protein
MPLLEEENSGKQRTLDNVGETQMLQNLKLEE